MSKVTCHMSCVTCQVQLSNLNFFILFLGKVVELVGGGSVINGATPSSSCTNISETPYPAHCCVVARNRVAKYLKCLVVYILYILYILYIGPNCPSCLYCLYTYTGITYNQPPSIDCSAVQCSAVQCRAV